MQGPLGHRALPFESDPVIEADQKDIDRTLLRENLKRSVEALLEEGDAPRP